MDKKVISLDHLEPFRKNFYEESRRLIRTAMADHNLVIFVGAGVSLDSGMRHGVRLFLRLQIN